MARNRARRRRWFVSAEGFRELRLSCLLSQRACADFLGVAVRSVRNWDRGRARVPWPVVRLLRILRNGELLGDAWAGWRLWGDTLYTPEGHAVRAGEASWLSLLVRQARGYREVTARLSAGESLPVGAAVADGCPPLPVDRFVSRDAGVASAGGGARSAPPLLPGLVILETSGTERLESEPWCGLRGGVL